ncbi:MAG TPA: G5 domain-containing protein [Anaerolineales bacterium]|nr:G5 domain-containing protein [Anaerolineales bacterium]
MTLWGCSQATVTQSLISVTITADQKELEIKIASGSTVAQVLEAGHIRLGELDKIDPGLTVSLSDGAQIKVTRLKEEFYVIQEVIPFDHQELKNEALPVGERLLSQPGVNGLREITYNRVYEDGVEVSNSAVKTVVIRPAIPEIEMVGSQSMFAASPIPGTIAYLSAGNAWIIEGNTANHKLVVPTGDLDGRIFSLSRDGNYLLYTRFSKEANVINSLWLATLSSDPINFIDLGVKNIVRYAEINTSSNRIAYSTAEWREASPGWQANNNLFEIDISTNGMINSHHQVLESNSGGVYGWWGTEFAWAPDQSRFLYSRPDGVGIISDSDKVPKFLYEITPFQTGGNWAWVPGAAWSPDGSVIYSVSPVISVTTSTSQQFDLVAIPLVGGTPVNLVKNVGMFAYPEPSPLKQSSNLLDPLSGEAIKPAVFSVAYLQAVLPEQSETSNYRLYVMDRDGSNPTALFPKQEDSGLAPQRVAWSPSTLREDGNLGIVLVYNGNIWIIDAGTGDAEQVTGDGLTTRIDWR